MTEKQKILIVDDKKENLVALRQVLGDLEAEVVEATSGNKALAATLEHDFAVAILDVMMPVMDGYELAGHLRGDKKTRHIPIVFVTAATAYEQHMFKGYEAGAIDYITKPYKPEVMVGKVNVLLDMDRNRRELQRHRDELAERVKEIKCLQTISSLVAEPRETVEEMLNAAVELIPPGWQYPEITCARVVFENREFVTANFKETPWRLSTSIDLSGQAVGRVDVFYLEEMPQAHEGPFLGEEQELIIDIARQLGVMIQRKKTEKKEKKLQDQLFQLQKTESLGRMAGSIAHHFNNQLSVVMGNLELVLGDLPDDADNREFLVASFEAGRKATKVSQQMLHYLGHISESKTTIKLSDVCRQSLAFLQPASPNGVTFNVDFPDSGPFVYADAGRIQQVLTNLLTNARESLPDNKGIIGLIIQTVSHEDIFASNIFPLDWRPKDNPYACLEISDTGCGVPGEDIEKLFDPFYTTKFTGRGMGLPVTMGILKTHNGCITVDSEPETGTVFRVYLPVSTEQKPVKHKKATTPKGKVENGGTVLLVEDEESVRDMAEKMISRLGYRVIEAQDGVEALTLFQEHQNEIDCVLSDLTMPRMNGWETLTALREKGTDVPVILASGYDEATVMAGDHPELPQGFLNKPYSMAALKDVLMEVIRL